MKKIGDIDMEAAEQTLQRNLENVELCDVQLNSVIRHSCNGAEQFDGKRNEFVQGAVKLDLISVARKSDIL